MTVHKLTAGDGYTYLTRQVAAQDATHRGPATLADYYSQHGEAPGVWMGRGLTRGPLPSPITPAVGAVERRVGSAAGTVLQRSAAATAQGPPQRTADRLPAPARAVSGQVREEQMLSLFGEGRHPDAHLIERDLTLAGAPRGALDAASRLGAPYRVYAEAGQFPTRLAVLLREHNTAQGLPGRAPVPAGDRARLRTQLARAMFAEQFGRPPVDARELAGHLARLTRQRTTAVAGYDLTFSPVKSVSALWALAPRAVAEQIEAAHHEAVADVLTWLEDHAAYTRTGRNGIAQVDVTGLIAAAFTHRDSRAGDPDLHTHVAIANKVQALDGRWLALDGRMLYKANVAASERYNTRLEGQLTARLGVTWQERATSDGKRAVREIRGMDGPLTARWSARRTAIDAHRAVLSAQFTATHGRPPTAKEALALAQEANLATRDGKHPPRSHAEQRAAWHAEAADTLGGTDAVRAYLHDALYAHPTRAPATAVTPAWVHATARAVLDVVSSERATWSEHHLRAETERHARRSELRPRDLDRAVDAVVAHARHPTLSVALDAPTAAGAERSSDRGPAAVPARADGQEHQSGTWVLTGVLAGAARPVGEGRTSTDSAVEGPVLPALLRRSDGCSVHTVAGSQVYTSAEIIGAEQRLLAAAARADGRRLTEHDVDGALLQAVAAGVPLNPGQAQLVRALATSGRRVQLALAPAGTGKTTALRTLARAWTATTSSTTPKDLAGGAARTLGERAGTVVGLAPSAAAAAVLRDELNAPTDTLAKLLTHLQPGGWDSAPAWLHTIDAHSLVVIDEAGMAGTRELAAAVDWLLQRGASVRLVGDDRQLAAVGAGGVLRDLAHAHGAVTLSQVVRFTDPRTGAPHHAEGAASLALRDGDPAAIGFYLDHSRVHVGDHGTSTADAYTAWQADRTAGTDSLLLAPTRDAVTALNLRAQTDRVAAASAAGQATGRQARLADGTTASSGDTVLSTRNERRLALSRTDWVKNGDRWTVLAVGPRGELDVQHARTGRRRRLPADYVASSVRLGYASTVHAAQGVTADTCHVVVSGAESRGLLYVALTRGRHANHVYLDVAGDGDPHTLTRRDTLLPPTAADVLARILARDDAATSATSIRRDLLDPGPRLQHAADSYTHAVDTAVADLLGPAGLRAVDAAAQSIPTLLEHDAWPALRAHLALLALSGTAPADALRAALTGTERSAGSAHDLAAVLDWRLDSSRPSAGTSARDSHDPTGQGPLPWLPALPARLRTDPQWGPVLRAYAHQVHTTTTQVVQQSTTWTPATAPRWALPLLTATTPDRPARPASPHASRDQHRSSVLGDLAVWRAAHGVDPHEHRPTGPPARLAADRRAQHHLDARVAQHLADPRTAAARWAPLADSLEPRLRRDPSWPLLAERLTLAAAAGIAVGPLLRRVAAERPLPDELPAAALWWRLAHHLAPAAVTADHPGTGPGPRPDWTADLPALLDQDTVRGLFTDPAWPGLVAAVDHAQRRGWTAADVLHTAHGLLLAALQDSGEHPEGSTARPLRPDQLATALTWRIGLLTDPVYAEPAPGTDGPTTSANGSSPPREPPPDLEDDDAWLSPAEQTHPPQAPTASSPAIPPADADADPGRDHHLPATGPAPADQPHPGAAPRGDAAVAHSPPAVTLTAAGAVSPAMRLPVPLTAEEQRRLEQLQTLLAWAYEPTAEQAVALHAPLRRRATAADDTALVFHDNPQHVPELDLRGWTAAEAARTRASVLRLHERAAAFYAEQLPTSWAGPYLSDRLRTDPPDLTAITGPGGLGYAPAGWTSLVEHLRAQGALDSDLLAAGLATRASTGTLIDRFRDRAMFAIRGPDGIHGWIGRRHPDITDPTAPKYLNTGDSPAFRKGHELYGLHEQHAALTAGAVPVLVEGPLDALAVTLASGGTHIGIAPLGTALTDSQAAQLAHACTTEPDGRRRRVVVATDADHAGEQAALRAYWKLTLHGDAPQHLTLPAREDPASLLRTAGPHALRAALGDARPLAHVALQARLRRWNTMPRRADGNWYAETTIGAVNDVAPILAALPGADRVELLLALVARTTALPEVAISLVADARERWEHDPAAVAAAQLRRLAADTPLADTPLADTQAPDAASGGGHPGQETLASRPAPGLPRRGAAPARQTWAGLGELLVPGLTRDPHWPTLAATIEQAATAGYDVQARLPLLVTAHPLPSEHTALEINQRLARDRPPPPFPAPAPAEADTRASRPPPTARTRPTVRGPGR